MSTPVYAHGIRWTFGEPGVFRSETPEGQARLDREGLAGYYDYAGTPWELAASAAKQTMADTGITPDDLDLIVYSCESTDSRVDLSRDPSRFGAAIGADHVALLATTANVCANLAAALRIARNCVAFGDASTVLVVTTDVWDHRTRLVDAGTCLMSDAAAAMIVSAQAPEVGWRIGDIYQATDHTMHDVDPGMDTIRMVRQTAGGMKRSADGFFADADQDREDYPVVVAGNVGTTVLRVLAAAARLDVDRFVTQPENGHCFAADAAVNLEAAAPRVRSGDKVLALSTGHNYWACMSMERVDGSDRR